MLGRLRPYLRILTDPIGEKIHINPDILTITGLLVGLLSAYMFARGNLIIGGVLIGLSGFIDIVDGAVARNHSSATKFGGILDSTCDRFTDAFVLIGIIYGGFVDWLFGILALHASLSVSYVRARAEVEGISCNVGVAERAERLVILMAGAFLNLLNVAVILVMILGYLTVLQRIYHSWKQLKER